MAKTGFIYYTVDTDRYQDRRIRKLRKDIGCPGMAVYDYLLCNIYRVHGCFIEWDEDTAFDVAEYFGMKDSLLKNIIDYCCSVGLFDRELRDSGNVLTSVSIQQRYVWMCVSARRTRICIPPEICLINIEEEKKKCSRKSVDKTSGNSSESSGSFGSSSENMQEYTEDSHIDKSKVNKSKVSLSTDSKEIFLTEDEIGRIDSVFFWHHRLKNPERKQEVGRFIAHYQSTGWVNSSGIPIVDKIAIARNWTIKEALPRITEDKEFMPKWLMWYKAILPTSTENASLMISDLYSHTNLGDNHIRLSVSHHLHELLEANIEYVKSVKLFSGINYFIPKKS